MNMTVTRVWFLFLIISNAFSRHPKLDGNLKKKYLIHTFQIEIEETSSLPGLWENSMEADEQ